MTVTNLARNISTLLLLSIVLVPLSAQVDYYKESIFRDSLVVLIGPENVERYSEGQTELYIQEYYDLIMLYEAELININLD